MITPRNSMSFFSSPTGRFLRETAEPLKTRALGSQRPRECSVYGYCHGPIGETKSDRGVGGDSGSRKGSRRLAVSKTVFFPIRVDLNQDFTNNFQLGKAIFSQHLGLKTSKELSYAAKNAT